MSGLIDLTGQRFGRLTVLREFGRRNNQVCWECRCDCGNIIYVRSYDLRSGHTKSCGCYQIETSTENIKAFHVLQGFDGRTQHPTYQVWKDMMRRCYDPHNSNYANYGGRGISVCEEWKDLQIFQQWALSHGFKKNLQLDRIDNDGNYVPENCRFVTRMENCNNKRNNHLVQFHGEVRTLAEWSRILDIPYRAIIQRLRRGWSVERTFTERFHSKKSHSRKN